MSNGAKSLSQSASDSGVQGENNEKSNTSEEVASNNQIEKDPMDPVFVDEESSSDILDNDDKDEQNEDIDQRILKVKPPLNPSKK